MRPPRRPRSRFVGPYDPDENSDRNRAPYSRTTYGGSPYGGPPRTVQRITFRWNGFPGQPRRGGPGDAYGNPFNPFYSTGRPGPEFFYHPEPVKTYGGNLRFSMKEMKDLFAAFICLSLALAILVSRWDIFGGTGMTMTGLLASMLTVGTGFLLHELAHKFSAQHFGCWSEFRASYKWLMISIFTALLGFLIAIPGAVEIRGRLDRRSYGKISLAGPATNLAIVLVLSPLLFVFSGTPHTMVQIIVLLNLLLALFNMLPIHPFDGAKILDWDSTFYGIFAIGTLVLFLVLLPYANPL